MSVSADISLMDILFDRDDPVLKFVEDRDVFKQDIDVLDPKNDLLNDKSEAWPTDTDDFFKDILNGEQFNLLENKNGDDHYNDHLNIGICDWKPVTNDGSGVKEVVVGSASSTYSDSGLSSDQVSLGLPNNYEFSSSPMDDDDDEHLSSAVSSVSDTSVQQMTLQDIKLEMQDVDFFDSAEDEQAVLGLLAQESRESRQNNSNKRKIRQVLNVSPVNTSNPRSILLPVSTGNGVRTYKIVSGGNNRKTLKAVGNIGTGNQVVLKTVRPVGMPLVVKNVKNASISKKIKMNKVIKPVNEDTDEEEVSILSDSEDDKVKTQYPRLILSPEEKKLMQKEGVTLPTHYPLTKFEERELKRIRRKIRNKISAQDSRKRKKEYLDGLEDRVKQCTEENLSLVKKIKFLQSQNQSLMAQLKKLQMTLARTTTKTAQPATCLMVIMLSVALVMAPNLRLTQNNENEVAEQDISATDQTLSPIAGRTRSLLSKSNPQEECCTMEEEDNKLTTEVQDFLQIRSGKWSANRPSSYLDGENPSDRSRKSSVGSLTSGYDSPPHFLADHDYDPPPSKRNRFEFNDHKIRYDDFQPYDEQPIKKEFIIPPVDDSWPHIIEEPVKPKEFIIPDVDDEWIPNKSAIMDKIESITTEVKVNISDSKGTRTVVIQVPKEKK